MIFGYINGTDEKINLGDYFMEDYINSNKSLINKLIKGKKIENNIFGYIILEKIKLIYIPNEIIFYNKGNNTILTNNSILEKDYILNQNDTIIKTDRYYYLEYQNIISEPDYDIFDRQANQTIGPLGHLLDSVSTIDDQTNFYNPKNYYGRTNTL